MESNTKSATWRLAVAYGLPNFGLAILLGPVQGLLQGYFTKNYDVKLEQIAWIFIMAPLLAGVVDPWVGLVSDHYRDRFWGRRSWLVGGAALSLFCTYHLFIVPSDLTVAYCGFWVILGFIAWTISEITYNAWGTELTSDYDSRTRIFSYKSAMGFIGTLIFLALPNLVTLYQIHVQGVPAAQTSRDFTPLSMQVSFRFLAIAMPVFVMVALWVCPGGSHVRKTQRKRPLEVVRVLFSNKSMLVFMATFATLGISGGMQTAMGYLHLSTYLRLGQDASLIYTIACLSYLLGVPVWNRVAAARGRHVALMIGLSINIVLFVALGLLQPSSGEAAWLGKPPVFWQYLIILCGLNFSQVVYYSLSPAIVGDISDAAMLETKEDQSATYFAAYTFIYKLSIGTGLWLALYMAGAVFGFNPKAEVQAEAAALGIKTMMGFMPAALVAISIGILLFYPITRAKYLEIQERIKGLGMKVED